MRAIYRYFKFCSHQCSIIGYFLCRWLATVRTDYGSDRPGVQSSRALLMFWCSSTVDNFSYFQSFPALLHFLYFSSCNYIHNYFTEISNALPDKQERYIWVSTTSVRTQELTFIFGFSLRYLTLTKALYGILIQLFGENLVYFKEAQNHTVENRLVSGLRYWTRTEENQVKSIFSHRGSLDEPL